MRDVSRFLSLPQGAKTKLPAAVDSKSKHTCCCRPAWNFESKSWLQKEKAFIFCVLGHLDGIVKRTLFAKPDGQDCHLFKCSNRESEECGVIKFNLMEEEEDVGPEAPTVNWQKFEYVNVRQTQDRREKRKFQLVRKETPPGATCKMLLNEFLSHQFRATWQSKEMKECVEPLP